MNSIGDRGSVMRKPQSIPAMSQEIIKPLSILALCVPLWNFESPPSKEKEIKLQASGARNEYLCHVSCKIRRLAVECRRHSASRSSAS